MKFQMGNMRLVRWFKTGLVSILPTGIVIYLIYYLIKKLQRATYWVSDFVHLETYWWGELLFPVIFLLLAVALIIIVGVASTTLVGRGAARLWHRLIQRIPVLNRIYLAVQQVLATISFRQNQLFRAVVMIEYPSEGMYRIGFITAEGLRDFLPDEEMIAVLIPSSPNPMTGYLFVTTRDKVRVLDIAVEDAIKMIMSVGFVAPGEMDPTTGEGPAIPSGTDEHVAAERSVATRSNPQIGA